MTAVLECRGVACGYETAVLENVDLVIEPGEIVALLGTSGCGKTTLLRTITGLLPPLAGDVLLFGEPLYELSTEPLYELSTDERNRLLRRVGTAFQQDALFGDMTVEGNVALPLCELTDVPPPVVAEMVRMRLALVGLSGLERRPSTSLSGGQRKRAALARATILDPEVVFCDEPSAGLDPVVAAGIDAMLLQLREILGSSLVVVSHELESIRAIADRAVMLAHGTVHAVGTIAALSASADDDVYNFFHRVPDRTVPQLAR
jgi:phospholipid/cholesterol/gamma-HCH transport system ATP-binding protein